MNGHTNFPRSGGATRPSTARVWAVSVVLCCGAVVSGCADPTGPGADPMPASAQRWSPEAAGPRGDRAVPATVLPVDLAGLHRGDPDATARAALRIWFDSNTNTDAGPNDAAARSAPLLTARLRAALTSTGSLSPGARWLQRAARHASAAVRVDPSIEAVPPQTRLQAIRVYRVTQTWFTPTGELLDTTVFTVGIVLERNGNAWEVSDVQPR
ncbi:hypothetical protein ACTD5D_21700 [Nocardia takedensis]|uniref:hypothetical protein n=1 Tax=Nocardia takedensis TaxID=259390 RepID=UPI003F763085